MSKSRRNLLIAIISSLLIVTFGVLRILEIRDNHKINMKIAEACMDNGGTVVSETKHIFSLTDVSCE
ncbi:hypothetical protein RGU12_04670 [Fredinandcohnia sp. QZ13]|uniref:hypothetical protein n=1 Tax=Fredinandcohnia sp. QZ13 TaxID=3073144 RepID=UPI002853595C|nr:hypothetical protein [Fredinandcohnia sp. QZ13]MDR4886846.1 hypothetical protein [Fredinandcohnia sp. QZ13]